MTFSLERAGALLMLFALGACAKSPSAADPCPADPHGAEGSRCAPEGRTCGTDSSSFTHFIMCSSGKWIEMEAPPPPPPPSTKAAPSVP